MLIMAAVCIVTHSDHCCARKKEKEGGEGGGGGVRKLRVTNVSLFRKL